MTESEFCLRWSLAVLSAIVSPIPYGETLTATIVKTYHSGHVFSGFPALSQDFRLVKITSPIIVHAEPYSLAAYLGGSFVQAYAYYMPVSEPLPDYPEPGTGPYEGGNTMPEPGMGRSGGGGASGEWGVKRDPDTGGGWYLPRTIYTNTVTAAFTSFDNNDLSEDSHGFVAFFWVFSGSEGGDDHILRAPFHSWTSRGTTVSFPGKGADVQSDLLPPPGSTTVLYGYEVGAYHLISGDVYIAEINVNIYEAPDYPAMYFPPRDSELPETPGFLLPRVQGGSIIPAVAALMGLRLWGKKRGNLL